MANEISITSKLSARKNYLNVSKSQTLNANMSGTAFTNAVQNIATTYEQVAVPAEVATAGHGWFRNLDTTNFVEIGVVVSSTFYPLLKLKPGEVAMGRLSSTTFYAKADTAAVNLEVFLLAD